MEYTIREIYLFEAGTIFKSDNGNTVMIGKEPLKELLVKGLSGNFKPINFNKIWALSMFEKIN